MSALPAEQLHVVMLEDILKLASERPDTRFEVINGHITEKPMVSARHHIVLSNIKHALSLSDNDGFCFTHGLLYVLKKRRENIERAYMPDVSFIRKQNMPSGWHIEQPFPFAPDLAIEVMSPNDLIEETLVRVREYLAAGTQQVWVVFPRLKEVHVYSGDTVQIYLHDAVMDVAELFPGLTVRVSEFFAVPAWMQPKGE